MKIAFLNIYGGRISRGAEVSVHELAQRLSNNNDVTVYQTGVVLNSSYKIKKINKIPSISTDVSGSFIKRLLKKLYLDPYSLNVLYFSLSALPDLLKQKYDFIIPINGFWQIIICKLAGRLRGGKILVFGYSGIGIDDYINLKLKPDAFFAMTHFAAAWAKKISPKTPIYVLPGGVDLKLFHPKGKTIKLDLEKPIILTVAALVPYKRVDLVIRAVSLLQNASLVIAGNGPLKDEIIKLTSQLIPGRFKLIEINYTNLPALYRSCNLFTLPSLHKKDSLFEKLTGSQPSEAFGIVYLEAMACGLPIVAPNDQLRQEIIADAGFLVDCENIEKYSLAIESALMQNWRNAPRVQAEKFDWDKIVKKFTHYLTDLNDSLSTN